MPDASPFPAKETVLIVDDASANLQLMFELLKDRYKVALANSGDKALKIARGENPPDLILLDIVMPGMSGYDVCRELKSDPAISEIPVIFLTSMTATENEERGFELGAVDYITKPVSPPLVLARIKAHLHIKATADFLKDKAVFLENEVTKRTREVVAAQDVTIVALASLAETRDNETGNHLRRTQQYVRALAEKLSERPRFAPILTPRQITILFKSAPLHDIGKVGIPDRILRKPGPYDPEEYEIMKTHTTIGRDAIAHSEEQLGTNLDFLSCAKDIAIAHHEKWDGSGYPHELKGEAIPLSARLMAVADVYDALISVRVYKPGMSHEDASEIIVNGRGKHFDPDVVDAFMEISDRFQTIASLFRESGRGHAVLASQL